MARNGRAGEIRLERLTTSGVVERTFGLDGKVRMTRTTRCFITVWAVFAVLAAGGCSDAPDRSGRGGVPSETSEESSKTRAALNLDDAAIELRTVVEGLEQPLLVTNARDGSDRQFIVEQVGRIRIVRDGELLAEPFLDVSEFITAGGEQGLLGLAFHPEYRANGRFFINYTDLEGDTVVAEYQSDSAEADVASPDSARILLRVDQPYANHNGGALAFGPDGYLYIALGDGGSGGDPHNNGQRLDTMLGKLLRIDVDSTSGDLAYGIPDDNPFVDRDGARPEIWAYGLRNPWRFAFDGDDIWIGDVGQSQLEEINRMPAARAGLNYGWNVMEGDACYEPPTDCDRDGLVLPVATYTHDEGCSVTGGYVYRGSISSLVGAYVFGDYCSGTVWAVDASGRAEQDPVQLLSTDHSISSFGLDERGELYVTDLGGTVLQVVEAE
ncbi:MAG: PQQ-dependent sugar dehydrogenase [Actinomycetota bacterium]|nr:PQQ-dependent sugar dehydrogenase [Actinomycetota bacterium]